MIDIPKPKKLPAAPPRKQKEKSLNAVRQAYFHYNSLVRNGKEYAIPIRDGLKDAIDDLNRLKKIEETIDSLLGRGIKE
jgi:hypothetical protein